MGVRGITDNGIACSEAWSSAPSSQTTLVDGLSSAAERVPNPRGGFLERTRNGASVAHHGDAGRGRLWAECGAGGGQSGTRGRAGERGERAGDGCAATGERAYREAASVVRLGLGRL